MRPLRLMPIGGLLLTLAIPAAYADALRDEANANFKPIPEGVPTVQGQTVTPAQVDLGKQLFFEPRLSSSHVVSCNSCHNVGTGGADNVPTSTGHGGQKGGRNSPTVFNAVFNAAQFWDGRAKDLQEQAKGPVQNPVEMHNTPKAVERTLASIPEYVDAFKKAFPGEKDPVNFENMARAIQAFESTLITPDSRFDKFLMGDDNALNAEEKKGLKAFMDNGCVSCHNGVNVGGQDYFPFGVVEKPADKVRPVGDKGREEVTKSTDDAYVFRVAPLRNVALTAPYFHSGQVQDLKEAVAIMGQAQLGKKLGDEDIQAITAFLKTLTGKQPQITYPLLPPSTDTTPRPQ